MVVGSTHESINAHEKQNHRGKTTKEKYVHSYQIPCIETYFMFGMLLFFVVFLLK